MSPLRVGVVGVGFGQAVHVPAFRSQGSCEVMAICASTADRAASVAARLAIPFATGDWRDLVRDPLIDLVSVAVPPGLQPRIVAAALEHGKHVLCEKPMATSAAEARWLASAAVKAGVTHAIDFEYPESQTWRRAAVSSSEGDIGPIRQIYVDWRLRTRAAAAGSHGWKLDHGQGGGAYGGFLSHALYHIELMGGRIDRVRARHHGRGDVVLAIDVWAELESGGSATVSIATSAVGGSGHRLELCGSSGSLRLDEAPDHPGVFRLALNGTLIEADPVPDPSEDARVAHVSRLIARMVESIRQRGPMRPDLRDGARVQELLDATHRSALTDAWIACNDAA